MVVARQEPPWAARSSYYASLYSAQQASQTASAQGHDDNDQNGDDQQPGSSGFDNKVGSVFSTATDLVLGATTATLENGVTATTPATSAVGSTTQSLASSESLTSSDILTSQSTMQTTSTPSMTTSISWTQPAWRPGWHSYVPSYINTATAAETSAASLVPGLSTQEKAHHGPNTTVIAGVVIPIVILLASGLVALTCLRRRRKRAAVRNADNATVSNAVGPVAMVEKVAGKKVNTDVHRTLPTTMLSPIDEAMAAPQLPQLVLTSSQNATYFTGLDTFSVHSAATNEDPPPPYRARSMLSHTSSERRQPSIATQSAALVPVSPVSPVSPASPIPPVAHLTSPFSDANAIAVTRSPSQRSFASTLYSSNASVYEARPARRSTGPAEYVISRRSSTDDQMRVRSPFDDPEDESAREHRERQ
ncbi:hypothetical protein QM012_004103 [Aureobasidium pullulans]|uniref:Uncharacterized protein n=1 Tax=Aureobasidium pullulans TaxID=5580 RepID=A0ABR0T7W8_AURPU